MDTIRSLLSLHECLRESDTSRLDCELLLSRVLKKDRTYLYTWPEKAVSIEASKEYKQLLDRRVKGEPIAYILGEKEFWSLPIMVDSSTLIPRPDTELLVETVLELMSTREHDSISVADLGAGTGAIGLALASEKPHWRIRGLERQENALALAQKNKQNLSLDNITFHLSDWFDAVDGSQFDVIVSNPPYIDACDRHLSEGDVRFEPKTALVADQMGFADLAFIVQTAPRYLQSGGWLLLEHGNEQGEQVSHCMHVHGFTCVETRLDLSAQPRVTLGQFV